MNYNGFLSLIYRNSYVCERPGFFSCVDISVANSDARCYSPGMNENTGKRIARVRTTLTRRTVEALKPTEKSWIAWDDKLTGLRRSRPALGHQVVHRQLPRRLRRPQGAQQAGGDRTLRPHRSRPGAAHGPGPARTRRPWRGSCRRTSRCPRRPHPGPGFRGLHGG